MIAFLKQPAVRITLIATILTAILASTKLAIGYWGNSDALFADGIHSISDIFIDILIIFAAHYGNLQADENHPYGHGRIETAATFGLASILLIAALSIIWDAGKPLWGGVHPVRPEKFVLWVAIAAVIVNEVLFRYMLTIAKRIGSALIEANAWHSRSDAAVSVIVLLSIIGSLLGFPYLDPIGAVIVAILIGKMGTRLAWRSISELVDTGVDSEVLTNLRHIISHVPGVRTLHHLRTRTIKNAILIDVHILVAPTISVSEGHFIGDQVIIALRQAIAEISDITVHVDPEDDEINHPCAHLPNRDQLTQLLHSHWQTLDASTHIQEIQLHYLNGKIAIEIFLPLALITKQNYNAQQLQTAFQHSIADLSYINTIKLNFFLPMVESDL